MTIKQQVEELLKASVIDAETAQRIETYYITQRTRPKNRFGIVFSLLGTILACMGASLLISEGWEEFSRFVQCVIAFLPLACTQLFLFYVLWKRPGEMWWEEIAAILLFFAIPLSLNLSSLIYHIQAYDYELLRVWMFLILPVIYLMRSRISSLLYLVGITYYVLRVYAMNLHTSDFYYWIFFAAILPQYYYFFKEEKNSWVLTLHHWLVPLSFVFAVQSMGVHLSEISLNVYLLTLFALYSMIGSQGAFCSRKLGQNSYRLIALAGTLKVLLEMSFQEFWKTRGPDQVSFLDALFSRSDFPASLLIPLAILFILYRFKQKEWEPEQFVFLGVIPICIFPNSGINPALWMNLWVLVLAVFVMLKGIRINHLGWLNLGLAMIFILAVCRYFETELSFIIRGGLFMLVGLGFLLANYTLIKRRRSDEQ